MNRREFLRKTLVTTSLLPGSLLLNQGLHPLRAKAQTLQRTLKIASTKDLGVVGKPASVLGRDGGATLLLGNQLLWIFNDTLVRNDTRIRSNTAALADPRKPLITHEPLDTHGRPYQFIPFTTEEQAYNDKTGI
ncbi:hypothetical protein KSF_100830 [Reticulibacter mediterranei]|uniref:Uncharacterized protein n=1 Tax=Reticulibacter mediterranei TaxID=2778369 RepID=A0A8J3J0D3_9CHLR|nr:hypothetical protein [Reticulibacter mediterranei]GHP00036.1 hypothetical protein KSF_100830 [Reticulibacter mediterranei]